MTQVFCYPIRTGYRTAERGLFALGRRNVVKWGMPAQSTWLVRIPLPFRNLELALPRPFVDRPVLESLLGIGRRGAQEIIAPCVSDRIGSSGLADRDPSYPPPRGSRHGDAGPDGDSPPPKSRARPRAAPDRTHQRASSPRRGPS